MKHPQPIGIYPFPANYLMLPASQIDSDEHRRLVAGAQPSKGTLYRLALNGDLDRVRSLCADDSPASVFNRFLLDPTPAEYERLQSELTGDFAAMLAVTAFTLNFVAMPPIADDVAPEIQALLLSAQATYDFECGETDAALAKLSEAINCASVSPVFAAQLKGNLAEATHQSKGPSAAVVNLYKSAIDVLRKTVLDGTVAALHLNLGICYQEMSQGNRGALLEAVKQYQEALKFFTRESTPEEYAFTHNNLALAYLSIPLSEASDTLRVAIAIQSLREALKIYSKDTHAELWASTQLNLANALQHAPSGHVEENLMEAVNLYDEILTLRSATENPIGYARLLANQGNALAHLGVFDHAVPKLTEARDIFNQIGETDSAEAIDEAINEIKELKDQTKAAGKGE